MIKKKLEDLIPFRILDWIRRKRYKGEEFSKTELYCAYIRGLQGVEIGGPSTIFKTLLPLYQVMDGLDGVNFSQSTVWEGKINQGLSYRFFAKKRGFQYIAEATAMPDLDSKKYDFLISSNCLEHIANPLKALFEWRRVIKKNGVIILVLPNKYSNFDHRRPCTKFKHLLDDFYNDISENDLTHLDEILELHDLRLDKLAGNYEEFKNRSLANLSNRALHHHVFEGEVIKEMMDFVGFENIDITKEGSEYFILAKRND
jgi:SAM-dependent methyltransferase